MSKELIKAEEKNLYIEKGIKIMKYAEGIVVTKDNVEKVKAVLQKFKNVRIEIDKKRKAWKKPALKECQTIDKIAKELTAPVSEGEKIVNDKINVLIDAEAEKIKKAEAIARKKHEEEEKKLQEEKAKLEAEGASKEEVKKFEEEKKEEIVEKVNDLVPEKIDVGGRKTITYEIPDDNKVERKLCSPDSKKINEYKKRNEAEIKKFLKDDKEFIVGGVKYFYKTSH